MRRGRGVGRGRQTGEQQDRVVAGVVELSPGLVRDLPIVQLAASPEMEGIGKRGELRRGPQAHVRQTGCNSRAQAMFELARLSAHGSGSPPSEIPSNSAVER